MTMKKLLSMLLCMALLLGTMTAIAYAAAPAAAALSVADDGTDEDDEILPAEEEPTVWEKMAAWWADFYPKFVDMWDTGFTWVSNILVVGFEWLLVLVGLR